MSELHAANEAFAVAFGNTEADGGADEGRMDVGLSLCVASFAEDDDMEKDEEKVGQDWSRLVKIGQDWLIVDCVASQAIVFLIACAFLTWFLTLLISVSCDGRLIDTGIPPHIDVLGGVNVGSVCGGSCFEYHPSTRQPADGWRIVRKFDVEMCQVGSDDGGSSGDGIPRNNRNDNEVQVFLYCGEDGACVVWWVSLGWKFPKDYECRLNGPSGIGRQQEKASAFCNRAL